LYTGTYLGPLVGIHLVKGSKEN